MEQKEKIEEEALYKVIRKKDNHQNTKINEDGSKAALQFTEDNSMDGPLEIREATDEEVVQRGKELDHEARTWKQIVWEEIVIPTSREAVERLLERGYDSFEEWMEKKAVPAVRKKSKMLAQNAGIFFSGVRDAIKGEEPKALKLIKETQESEEKKQMVIEGDWILEQERKGDNSEKIPMSAQEIEGIIALTKQSAEMLVACINLLRNTVVSDTALPEEKKVILQKQLESLTTADISEKIDLLLEDKNKKILDPASLKILKAFREGKFLIEGKEVPIRNYIENS